MKVKTSELTGLALDWAVAKAEGVECHVKKFPDDHRLYFCFRGADDGELYPFQVQFRPSTFWNHGGPIIERMKPTLEFIPTIGWRCALEYIDEKQVEIVEAETPLIAAMRCYVASKLGEEVEIPEELK